MTPSSDGNDSALKTMDEGEETATQNERLPVEKAVANISLADLPLESQGRVRLEVESSEQENENQPKEKPTDSSEIIPNSMNNKLLRRGWLAPFVDFLCEWGTIIVFVLIFLTGLIWLSIQLLQYESYTPRHVMSANEIHSFLQDNSLPATEGSPQQQALSWLQSYKENTVYKPQDESEHLQLLARYILAVDYFSWNKAPSYIKFLSVYQVCRWHSITGFNQPSRGFFCDKNNHQPYILELPSSSLKGTIPTENGALQTLHFLDLSHNQLTGTIPTELCQLSNLIGLHLHSNQLTGSVPSCIHTTLSKLESLRLDGNDGLTGQLNLTKTGNE